MISKLCSLSENAETQDLSILYQQLPSPRLMQKVKKNVWEAWVLGKSPELTFRWLELKHMTTFIAKEAGNYNLERREIQKEEKIY